MENSNKREILSVKLQDHLPAIMHIDLIERKAIELLNTDGAIMPYPVLNSDDKQCKRFMVAKSRGLFYTVKVQRNSTLNCECKGFRYFHIYFRC